MKRVILSAVVFTSLLINAWANLGETYEQSCKRYGGPGQAARTGGSAWLVIGGFPETYMVIFAYFKDGRCTQIAYFFNSQLTERGIHSLLAENGGKSLWNLVKDGYCTPDGSLVASLEQDGRAIRIVDKRGQ
jgi:hypothetical protein